MLSVVNGNRTADRIWYKWHCSCSFDDKFKVNTMQLVHFVILALILWLLMLTFDTCTTVHTLWWTDWSIDALWRHWSQQWNKTTVILVSKHSQLRTKSCWAIEFDGFVQGYRVYLRVFYSLSFLKPISYYEVGVQYVMKLVRFWCLIWSLQH